ncbi:hypothetical protein Pst134EA_025987 [Puccinia striiformis f. sp. tritici]|uniref:hypothetical protein n=1 Tax=Puccinia striiformis f. sp. tritici TaxID=168172 RepID=UPI00200735D5|nr:hypothetical protein Pst134EA_025987 [Puccinia striiformis f. sp. tritici]KAH9444213.1 hypothetical protein Pst134EB_026591 [Puccinia striiformis f. sp. tritici]KAH9452051.1 hypothetical protein Pst134EA_025987 [Puccinia striiformis f. sp. tritici]
MFDENNLPVRPAAPEAKSRHVMPDGTQLTLDQAKAYMIFYCCKFNFGSPNIQCETSKNGKVRQTWAATIHVGGRKIELSHVVNKKDSVNKAYLDTVVYLGQCDSNLWVEFLASPKNQEAAADGTNLSLSLDPALFKQYFADPTSGKTAPVISIPGRSFPVEKLYLEEMHHDLCQLSLPTAWEDPKVQKYIQRELQEPLALDQTHSDSKHIAFCAAKNTGSTRTQAPLSQVRVRADICEI